jgi:hypothetical protein
MIKRKKDLAKEVELKVMYGVHDHHEGCTACTTTMKDTGMGCPRAEKKDLRNASKRITIARSILPSNVHRPVSKHECVRNPVILDQRHCVDEIMQRDVETMALRLDTLPTVV